MSNESMTYQDLLQIVELIKSSSQFSEFRLKTGDMEVEIRRKGVPQQMAGGAPAQAEGETRAARSVTHPQRTGHMGGGEIVTEPEEVWPEEAHPHATLSSYPEGAALIRSPMVGTFYRAPEPGARPFVEVGQQADADCH